jgi:hypothetical protein
MGSRDQAPARQADVIAAARAAAAWARARRATWTDVPLAVRAAHPAAAGAPTAALPRADRRSGPSIVARAATQLRDVAPAGIRWLLRLTAVAAIGAVGVTGVRYVWNTIGNLTPRVTKPAPAGARPAVAPRKTTGDLEVKSTPTGAQVLVDGKPRGVTPLTVRDLSAGRHAIVLKSESGTVQRTVTIAAGGTAAIDESIFSGWLAVFAPFELTITENGRLLRLDDRHQIMMPPGPHELRLANQPLGFDTVRQVELKSGEMTRLSITPPPSSVTVTANDTAEVWIDGVRAGETPLNGFPVNLGTHEIVVRRASGGGRQFTLTVTVKPVTLNVDF